MEVFRINQNLGTRLTLDELGKVNRPYLHTYDFSSEFLNDNHKFYSECPTKNGINIDIGIDGWLSHIDALKIYELAYFSKGDILELGTYRGLSLYIMNQACNDAKIQNTIYTVDINSNDVEVTKKKLSSFNQSEKINFFVEDAMNFVNKMITDKKQFNFAFIDHSHEYEHVYQVCTKIGEIIKPKSFCVFHDYNDPRNSDPKDTDYGVFQAVNDGLSPKDFEFYGIFGACGLFRRT